MYHKIGFMRAVLIISLIFPATRSWNSLEKAGAIPAIFSGDRDTVFCQDINV